MQVVLPISFFCYRYVSLLYIIESIVLFGFVANNSLIVLPELWRTITLLFSGLMTSLY